METTVRKAELLIRSAGLSPLPHVCDPRDSCMMRKLAAQTDTRQPFIQFQSVLLLRACFLCECCRFSRLRCCLTCSGGSRDMMRSFGMTAA